MGRSYSALQPNDLLQAPAYDATGIILGFDIGLKSSGVSFALLLPDRAPEIQSVTRFTDQSSPGSKVPSIMYYDRHGTLVAAGASVVTESNMNNAELEGWTKVERFVMHLRPYDVEPSATDFHVGLLPRTKTAIQVMGDFLRYLYNEAVDFIKRHYVDGEDLWKKVSYQKHFVFSLPNCWDNISRHRMRQAVIHGGLISDSREDRGRFHFVTEGEAIVISCLSDEKIATDISPGHQFILVDAGESLLQVTTYEIDEMKPLCLKELSSSSCSFFGSASVNARLYDLLKEKLRGSRYDNAEVLDELVRNGFERTIKWRFNDVKQAYWLRVGSRTENDAQFGIQRGSMRLNGAELFDCFEPSVSDILSSIRQQMASCEEKSLPVWLVGSLSASPWLYKRLNESLLETNIIVCRPGINLTRAVADGCVSILLLQVKCERETRLAKGIVCTDSCVF